VKKKLHRFHTTVGHGTGSVCNEMSELPKFFDSQSQAAAMLKLDSYFLKELKAEGCTAFKPGGRIRRDELLDAIERKRERARERLRDADSDGEVVSAHDWEYRRSVLFDVLEFLHDAYADKRINLAKYAELGEATVEQLIKLGEVWEAGIDAPGFRKTWLACLAQAALRKNEENKRARG